MLLLNDDNKSGFPKEMTEEEMQLPDRFSFDVMFSLEATDIDFQEDLS